MNISLRKVLAAATPALAATILLAPMAASASSPSPSAPASHIGGIVPVHGAAKTGSLSSGSNLGYHNGPVMNTNTVYVIYWEPSGYTFSLNSDPTSATSYQDTINGFFTNVAAAKGSKTNVYAIDTQYYGPNGQAISNNETFQSSYVDTTPLPTSGTCTDSVTPVCVTDAQIQAEILTVMSKTGWKASNSSLFFVLTAANIGSCSGSSCAFTQYCAYHGDFTPSGTQQPIYYANMPDAGTDLSACGSGQYPNNNPAADSEINVLSHEHNEAITDEQLNAWYDRRGYEIGDKCAWNFGSTLGSTGYGNYNQSIGTGKYYLQQEWSNHSTACALTYPY